MGFTFPKINDNIRFEDLCRDILECKNGSAQKIGVSGQSQFGADIVSYVTYGEHCGEQYAQCKVRDKLSSDKDKQKFWSEIIADYNACITNYGNASEFIVITTASRDSYFTVELSKFNAGAAGQTVPMKIFFWEDITDLLETAKYRTVLEKYFSGIVKLNVDREVYGKRIELSIGVGEPITQLSFIIGFSPAVVVADGDVETALYRTNSYFVADVVNNWFRTIPDPGRCFVSDFEGIHQITELDKALLCKWLNEVVGIDPRAFITDEKRRYEFVVSREWHREWLAGR